MKMSPTFHFHAAEMIPLYTASDSERKGWKPDFRRLKFTTWGLSELMFYLVVSELRLILPVNLTGSENWSEVRKDVCEWADLIVD